MHLNILTPYKSIFKSYIFLRFAFEIFEGLLVEGLMFLPRLRRGLIHQARQTAAGIALSDMGRPQLAVGCPMWHSHSRALATS
jgi:hypothetical protein